MEWTKYTTKEALKDNDELMILDKDANANKRTLMDKIWNYVVDKMTTAVIAKLGTTNKTLIGAVNELNSNKQDTAMRIENASNLCEYMFSNCGRTGIHFYAIPSTIKVENGSPDGNGGFGIAYKSSSEDYGMIIIFSYNKAVYMKIKSTTWDDWKKVKFIE